MSTKMLPIARWLRRRAENVAVLLLMVMFVTFILQIVFRYVLDAPLRWSEEVIIATWLWTVLWGAAFTLSESEEIRFDIIYSQVSEKTRRVFTIVTGIALVLLYAVSLPAAIGYVRFMKVEHSASLRVPLDWMYSIFVVFSLASIVRYCWLVWHAFVGEKSPETDPARLGD